MSKYFPNSKAREFDQVRDLSPWAVEEFLQLSDWSRVESRVASYSVWSSRNDSASVMIPYDRSMRDYSARFLDALRTLSELTQLEGEALALEVVSARKDVFLIRSDQETPDGSIPFQEARRLVAGAEEMLKSSAASTLRPRASTAGPKAKAVRSFLADDVRMGHTLHGSFVLTVLAADADEERRRLRDWEADRYTVAFEPDAEREARTAELPVPTFARQVMSQMASGLDLASRFLTSDSPSVTLEEAVDDGVTLQLLESVQSMTASEGVRALDLSFRWSEAQPATKVLPTRVLIDRESGSSAPRVIERLRKRPEIVQDAVTGQVVRLDRADGAEDGVVVLDAYVGKDRRKVRVPLVGSAYRTAIAAHDEGTPVRVTGTLVQRERGWRMEPGAVLDTFDLPLTGHSDIQEIESGDFA